MHGVMMQYFHWYDRPEDQIWQKVKDQASALAQAGFSALWLPPPYKGTSVNDVGYGVYDLYDLGEFDQKGTVRTKYGSKAEYLEAIAEAHRHRIQVYADIVFNHRHGADAWEELEASKILAADRTQVLGQEVIEAATVFQFPGRGDRYSPMKWNWTHFDAVDFNNKRPEDGNKYIYLLKDKKFDPEVDNEFGNYDYLMGTDLDLENEQVREELKSWGSWFLKETNVDGFRFDALKHIRHSFLNEWLEHISHRSKGQEYFACGEYWDSESEQLTNFIKNTNGRIHLFDVPLHLRFHQASVSSGQFDMSKLLEGTLVAAQPNLAVTFVDNHDTQPLQALASFVEAWFKPLAYAVILLREQGYPCVFYLDYYGGSYKDGDSEINLLAQKQVLDILLAARTKYARGRQYDYFDHWDVVGWTRTGDKQGDKAMAVIMSDGADGNKWMNVERKHAQFRDLTADITEAITTNEDGFGNFPVKGRSLSVWVEE
jgi:alpha-amylase